MTAPVSCADCGDPVVVALTGWYRCRSCGYESLRPLLREGQTVASAERGEAAPAVGLSLYSIRVEGRASCK